MMTMLTAARARELLTYDPTSGHMTWATPLRGVRVGARAGSVDERGYRYVRLDRRLYREHRLAWLLFYGEWPPSELDHINGDRADNRIANLRPATRSQNLHNKVAAGYTVKRGKYRAQTKVRGKVFSLGTYDTPEQARAAYLAFKARTVGAEWVRQ